MPIQKILAIADHYPCPSRQFAILTCMDARLDPAKYAGMSEGDAPVMRNAGDGLVKQTNLLQRT